VPNRKIGLVDFVFVSNRCSVIGKQELGMREMQRAQGQLTSSKGPERMGNSPL
jgi:hypothetical protein